MRFPNYKKVGRGWLSALFAPLTDMVADGLTHDAPRTSPERARLPNGSEQAEVHLTFDGYDSVISCRLLPLAISKALENPLDLDLAALGRLASSRGSDVGGGFLYKP